MNIKRRIEYAGIIRIVAKEIWDRPTIMRYERAVKRWRELVGIK